MTCTVRSLVTCKFWPFRQRKVSIKSLRFAWLYSRKLSGHLLKIAKVSLWNVLHFVEPAPSFSNVWFSKSYSKPMALPIEPWPILDDFVGVPHVKNSGKLSPRVFGATEEMAGPRNGPLQSLRHVRGSGRVRMTSSRYAQEAACTVCSWGQVAEAKKLELFGVTDCSGTRNGGTELGHGCCLWHPLKWNDTLGRGDWHHAYYTLSNRLAT